jgi:hypothetical protein
MTARAYYLNLINESAKLTGYQLHKRGWKAAKQPTSPVSIQLVGAVESVRKFENKSLYPPNLIG